MKTTLLAQNDNTQINQLKANVGKSVEPLSHSVTFPVDVEGAIYPICCVETVPSDSFEISNEVLLRQLQPLKVPQMTRYTLNTAYFYCSNRLAWKKWPMFADQANKGRADINYTFELPRVCNAIFIQDEQPTKFALIDYATTPCSAGKNHKYKNTLHTYLGICMNHRYDTTITYANFPSDSDELPLAFPEFDYQMICRDFYTNIDRIPDNPDASNFYDFDNPFSDWAFSNLYPIDDDEIRLHDGINFNSGYDTSIDDLENVYKGFVLDKIRYHDLRDDYFTSSKRAPMRGEAPTVDTTLAVSGVDASAAVAGTVQNAALVAIGEAGFSSVESMLLDANSHGTDTENQSDFTSGWTTSNNDGTNPYYNKTSSIILDKNAGTANLKAALEKLKINLTTTKAINAAELRLLSQLTVWQELNMLHKPYYNDFLNAHFDGIKVGDSLVEAPQYIGGTSQVININEVLQTSATTESSPLGSQAAVAHSLAGSNVGKFFSPDFGFIIGVAYIIPDIVYEPAMPRWASRRTIEDYYFPEFANLSMQATLNKELFYSNNDEWNNQPLGYVGAYDELRSIPNRISGDLLNDDYTDLKAWVLRREMSNLNKPAINQRFLSAKGNVDMTAWSVPSAPKFMLQCANYIKSVRPMPSIAVPKAL